MTAGGRGGSGNTQPYAVGREVEDIAALIQTAGGAAYAYGISSGGALALEAARSGLPVKKLAMYEPPFVGAVQGDEYKAQLETLMAEDRRGEAVTLFLRTIGVPGFFRGALRLTPMWRKLKRLAPTLGRHSHPCLDGSERANAGDCPRARELSAERSPSGARRSNPERQSERARASTDFFLQRALRRE